MELMLELILAAIIILVIIGAIAYLLLQKKQNSSDLFKKKRAIEDELKTAETNFFKRKIPETEYRRIVQDKNLELIKIESEISFAVNKPRLSNNEMQIIEKVETKQRHLLQDLFDQKKILLKERELIQQKFHKRRIDDKIFQQMMNKNQGEIISVESKIKSIAKENEIEKTMTDLKQKTKEFKKEKEVEEEEALDALADQAVEEDTPKPKKK